MNIVSPEPHGGSLDPAGRGDHASAIGPTALRIALGAQLRQLREARGISREAAGEAIRGSDAKISRLELGRVGFKERDVRDLLTLYGVLDAEEREAFLELVRQANSPGWWHKYGDVTPRWFEMFLGLEQSASIIRTYEVQFVPGLLQTADYARAVMGLAHLDADEVERRAELRVRRQGVLTRAGAPTLWAVIEEAALYHTLVPVEVRRAQLQWLVEVGRRPNVTLQLVPLTFGGHAASGLPFTILRFAQPDLPDVVYLEQLTSALYLDKRQDVDRYAAALDSLCAQILPPDRTLDALQRLAAEL